MSIPARPDDDPDLVISACTADVTRLIAAVEAMAEALGHVSRMRTMPDHASNTFTLAIAHQIADDALSKAAVLLSGRKAEGEAA